MKVMLHCLGFPKVPVSPKSCPSPLPRQWLAILNGLNFQGEG